MEQRKKESGIRLEDVAAGYGRKALLNHISLHVSPGNVLTLIGPNGAGKSTILKTVTRQLAELGGTIFLEGTAMSRMREEEVARTLAMVMTERLHPEFMTCREVVATGRYPYTGRLGILSAEDWKLVDDAMQLVHAGDTADRNFSQISDGQRQRVMLARAICQEPRILILDEPTSYLDMGFKLDILTTIRMLARKKNLAVIMSLHELDLAQKVSDTIACVKGDRIDRVGTPEEIFSGNYVQQLYGVKSRQFDPQTGQVFMERPEGIPEVQGLRFTTACSGRIFRLQQAFCRKMMWSTQRHLHLPLVFFRKKHSFRFRKKPFCGQNKCWAVAKPVFVH